MLKHLLMSCPDARFPLVQAHTQHLTTHREHRGQWHPRSFRVARPRPHQLPPLHRVPEAALVPAAACPSPAHELTQVKLPVWCQLLGTGPRPPSSAALTAIQCSGHPATQPALRNSYINILCLPAVQMTQTRATQHKMHACNMSKLLIRQAACSSSHHDEGHVVAPRLQHQGDLHSNGAAVRVAAQQVWPVPLHPYHVLCAAPPVVIGERVIADRLNISALVCSTGPHVLRTAAGLVSRAVHVLKC